MFDLSSKIIQPLKVGTHGVLGDSITEAILRGALIVLTTIHAQDFQDVPGIVAPTASRISMILLLMWSMWLGVISQTAIAQIFLISAAIVVGGRFMLFRTVPADRISYILYNVRVLSYLSRMFLIVTNLRSGFLLLISVIPSCLIIV